MMEKKYYNILWIDDEHDGMSGFKGDAKFNNIKLNAYKSLNEGISELKKNYPIYDGVLLDAKFFENEDDVKGSEDTDNVHRAKEELLLLPKKFEVFVFTGQAEAFEDKTFNKAFKKVYKKGIDDDVEQLFVDIKNAADKLLDTQIRHKYNRVFDVCTERYIGKNAAHDLLELLNYNGCETAKFNQMRNIIEDLFQAFKKYDLLPKAFFNPNPAISEISKFLSGEDTIEVFNSYKIREESKLPIQISKYLKNIIPLMHSGSHRGNVDVHISTLRTPYLFKSVLFQLLDVLVWFKQFIDSSPLRNNWDFNNSIDVPNVADNIEGKIFKVAPNGWGTFKSNQLGNSTTVGIYVNLMEEYNLIEGSQLKITTKPSPCGKKTYLDKVIEVLN